MTLLTGIQPHLTDMLTFREANDYYSSGWAERSVIYLETRIEIKNKTPEMMKWIFGTFNNNSARNLL